MPSFNATREFRYYVYGLRLLADQPIPGLAVRADASVPDVRICVNRMPGWLRDSCGTITYEGRKTSRYGRPTITVRRLQPDGSYHILYDEGTEFLIEASGRQVWCVWPASGTLADASVYLRGNILGMLLRVRGIVCLHASSVAMGDSAIAIVGEAGSGKSTTAAAFVKAGFSLVADDIVALCSRSQPFSVIPGYPRLNLWADAAEALYGPEKHLPRLTPFDGIHGWWDKRYLDLNVEAQFQVEKLPLSAIYILDDRLPDLDAPRISEIPLQEALLTLVEHSYVNFVLNPRMRALEFQTLGQLLQSVPVRIVNPQKCRTRVADLCEAIRRNHEEVVSARARCQAD